MKIVCKLAINMLEKLIINKNYLNKNELFIIILETYETIQKFKYLNSFTYLY